MPATKSANSDMPKPIPLRWKFCRRFYEPILLEVALKKIRPPDFSETQHAPNSIRDSGDSAEQTFRCFVNRLAQVCDNLRGDNGATVTGIAVLLEPEGVHYIIGSNNRRAAKLHEVGVFVTELLNIAARTTDQQADGGLQVHGEALCHILKFDENRVRFYLTSTVEHLQLCIDDYDRRYDTKSLAAEASRFRRQLSELTELVKFGDDRTLDERAYFAACKALFLFIHDAQRQKLGDSISEQARDGEIDSKKDWIDLRHSVGRLHSYYLAVKTIVRASRLWKRLCHDFKVTVIPSAPVHPHPLCLKRPVAHEILGRMSSDEGKIATYRSLAAELQPLGLDLNILNECNDLSQTHMVHAEILVLDYVLKYMQENDDAKFWNNWRYIGSSKPTCRLCNYYFTAHTSGVQVRESHNNLYPHWRAPDVFDEAAMKATEKLLDAVIKRTRADAVRSLESQRLQGRRFDSNSFSYQPWQKTATSVSELISNRPSVSDLISNFSNLRTIDEEDGRSTAGQVHDDDEEDKIVFKGRRSLAARG
ncbi:hypothetical protein A9Z42_0056060 [Trichoderma parareesei]|uniref:Uncharacterized protein n=1 Tax=Trichoderma parareesei TaxID=858221 RepID=A0A2H2YVJ1_TRIPA|nr:hypothetical protein A9Z42_0056060 [Trichoderma parareesei]